MLMYARGTAPKCLAADPTSFDDHARAAPGLVLRLRAVQGNRPDIRHLVPAPHAAARSRTVGLTLAGAGACGEAREACVSPDRPRAGGRSAVRGGATRRAAESPGGRMSMTAKWRRRLARHLVAHAEKVLSPIRPTWAGVLKSELDHVPEDRGALRWAIGCVWASYMERYLVRSRSLLAA